MIINVMVLCVSPLSPKATRVLEWPIVGKGVPSLKLKRTFKWWPTPFSSLSWFFQNDGPFFRGGHIQVNMYPTPSFRSFPPPDVPSGRPRLPADDGRGRRHLVGKILFRGRHLLRGVAGRCVCEKNCGGKAWYCFRFIAGRSSALRLSNMNKSVHIWMSRIQASDTMQMLCTCEHLFSTPGFTGVRGQGGNCAVFRSRGSGEWDGICVWNDL